MPNGRLRATCITGINSCAGNAEVLVGVHFWRSASGAGTGDSPRVDAVHEHHQGGRCWFYSTELTGARGWVFTIPGTASLGGLLQLGALEEAMAAPSAGHSAARFLVFLANATAKARVAWPGHSAVRFFDLCFLVSLRLRQMRTSPRNMCLCSGHERVAESSSRPGV